MKDKLENIKYKYYQNKPMKKSIPIVVVSIIIFLIVAYFIFNYTVEKITEREVKRITQEEIGKITNENTDKITQNEVDRITDEIIKQKTEEITQQIVGVSSGAKSLQEIECDKKTLPRQFSSASYYTGPLIDAHLHMPFTFDVPKALYAQADYDGAVLEKDVAAGSIMCVFDKTGVQSAIGFYVIPSLLKGQAVVQIKQIEEKFPGRITPFIMPAHVSALNVQPADVESVLKANPGLFKGIGEIAMYKPAYKGTSPDDISFRAFYDIAASHGLTVMIHLDNGQREAIEKILQDYPGVNFLFHGHEMRSYVAEIVAKYPNAYYSIDGDLNDIPDEHESANLYGDKTKEEFVVKFKRDYETILATAITNWKGPIEKNPTKFLWGTDRGYTMHFDAEVGGLLDEISRSFIGQLDPAVQEKFAYKNAERLIGMSGENE